MEGAPPGGRPTECEASVGLEGCVAKVELGSGFGGIIGGMCVGGNEWKGGMGGRDVTVAAMPPKGGGAVG